MLFIVVHYHNQHHTCNNTNLFTDAVAHSRSVFGRAPSSLPIHLDEVGCTGAESRLVNCTHAARHDCSHIEDAGVQCNATRENVDNICKCMMVPGKRSNIARADLVDLNIRGCPNQKVAWTFPNVLSHCTFS